MTSYIDLDLDHVTADPELLGCIPYGLAAYYLALPLAREDGQVSVVMAHPENATALTMLSALLKASIVPVRGSAEAIRSAISRLHPRQTSPIPRFLAWSATVQQVEAVRALATLVSQALAVPLTLLGPDEVDLKAVLTLARQGQYYLTIVGGLEGRPLAGLLRCSATPLLLVRGGHTAMQRILIVMRGYASDDYTRDWIAPFAWQQGAAVTLMPLTEPVAHDLQDWLAAEGLTRQHVAGCVRRFNDEGVRPLLKFRQGHPMDQVVDEVAVGGHDLLVIAAEAHGDFVARVLAGVEARGVHPGRPVLIIKPYNP